MRILFVLFVSLMYIGCLTTAEDPIAEDTPTEGTSISMSSDAYGCGSRYILSDTKNRAFLTLKLPFDVVKDTTVSLDLATASAMEMIEYESAIFIRDYFCNDVIEVGEDVVSVSKITEAVQGTVIIEITGFNPEPFFPEYQLSISSEKIILDDGRELLEVRGAKTTLGWLPG